MNFLNIDQHIAVCADIKNIVNKMGHTFYDVSLSGHANIIGKIQEYVPMLSGDEWGVTIRERKWEEFHNKYGKMFDPFDCFVCTYPPIFSMLYKHFHQPIIIQIPIRYEYGAEGRPDLWEEFNDFLREGIDSKRIFLVANSVFDQKYTEAFLDRPVRYIPSLCEYTGMTYNPINSQFLYYASFKVEDKSGRMIKKHDALKAGHHWQMVADFRGCIHFPYNVSTMSCFEQYTACIPMLFPSKRYLLELYESGYQVLDQVSWNVQARLAPGSAIECNALYDPNRFDDIESVKWWLQYADYYQPIFDHAVYFDSLKELQDKLSLPMDGLMGISESMRLHNVCRKEMILKSWAELINEIKSAH